MRKNRSSSLEIDLTRCDPNLHQENVRSKSKQHHDPFRRNTSEKIRRGYRERKKTILLDRSRTIIVQAYFRLVLSSRSTYLNVIALLVGGTLALSTINITTFWWHFSNKNW